MMSVVHYFRQYQRTSYALIQLSFLLLLTSCSKPMLSEAEQQQLESLNKQIQSWQGYYSAHARPDFTDFSDSKEKKKAFFSYLIPAIKTQNLIVERDKLRLQVIEREFSQQQKLPKQLQQWFDELVSGYRVTSDQNMISSIHKLQQRIAPLPPALVLAQAANESAWGTSRFATQGNNYFGQWCYSKGCGMVPLSRNQGAIHEVAQFDSVYDSVAAYFRNLNSNKAYEQLRQIRSNSQGTEDIQLAKRLAKGLEFYSERGADYIADITRLIDYNRALIIDAADSLTEDI